MLKSKIVIVFLVCMFTNLSLLKADVGVDMASEKDMVSTAFLDGGEDVGADLTADMGVKRSTPMDPDFQPRVSSEAKCFCGSIQTESETHWSLLLLLGFVFGWTKKGRE